MEMLKRFARAHWDLAVRFSPVEALPIGGQWKYGTDIWSTQYYPVNRSKKMVGLLWDLEDLLLENTWRVI